MLKSGRGAPLPELGAWAGFSNRSMDIIEWPGGPMLRSFPRKKDKGSSAQVKIA